MLSGATHLSAQLPEWRVSADPAVSIGGEPSGPASDLFRAQPVILSDGTIVVGDAAPRLMFFDASGRFLKSVGRRGQGPGELMGMARVRVAGGDTIVITDSLGGGGRTLVFTPDGEFVRFVNNGAVPRPVFVTLLEDGDYIGSYSSPYPASPVGSVSRNDFELVRYDGNGRIVQSLASFPGTEVLQTPRLMISGYGLLRTRVAVHDRFVYVITGDDYEIHVVDIDRGQVRTITRPHQPVRYTARDVVKAFAGTSRSSVITLANLRRCRRTRPTPRSLISGSMKTGTPGSRSSSWRRGRVAGG